MSRSPDRPLNGGAAQRRPRYLNLFHLRFPAGAICSFGHRVSGALLAAYTVALAFLLRCSLESPSGYEWSARAAGSVPGRVATALFLWALAHHALAGVRHLLMDVDIGSSLQSARRSARSVNVLGVMLALFALGAIW